jgi:hypothetical protein
MVFVYSYRNFIIYDKYDRKYKERLKRKISGRLYRMMGD